MLQVHIGMAVMDGTVVGIEDGMAVGMDVAGDGIEAGAGVAMVTDIVGMDIVTTMAGTVHHSWALGSMAILTTTTTAITIIIMAIVAAGSEVTSMDGAIGFQHIAFVGKADSHLGLSWDGWTT